MERHHVAPCLSHRQGESAVEWVVDGDAGEPRKAPFGKFGLNRHTVQAPDGLSHYLYVAAFPDGAEPVLLFSDRKSVAQSVYDMW